MTTPPTFADVMLGFISHLDWLPTFSPYPYRPGITRSGARHCDPLRYRRRFANRVDQYKADRGWRPSVVARRWVRAW